MALLKVGKQNINQEDCMFPRKIEKAYFVTELNTILIYNSQSMSTSISLTPALFIHYILWPVPIGPYMLLSLQLLKIWGSGLGIQI